MRGIRNVKTIYLILYINVLFIHDGRRYNIAVLYNISLSCSAVYVYYIYIIILLCRYLYTYFIRVLYRWHVYIIIFFSDSHIPTILLSPRGLTLGNAQWQTSILPLYSDVYTVAYVYINIIIVVRTIIIIIKIWDAVHNTDACDDDDDAQLDN